MILRFHVIFKNITIIKDFKNSRRAEGQRQQKQKVKTNLAAIFDDTVPTLGKTNYFFREKVIFVDM